MVQQLSFTEEEIVYPGDGIQLAGTLLLPATSQPCPAVVCVHGSGPDTRTGYRWIGESFARQGIAALIYDKRGTGLSGGNWKRDKWSFRELANDALGGIRYLKQRPEIDGQQVGLWGISEGGWVVPMAAASSQDVDFVITISAAGISPLEQERYRRGLQDRESSHSAVERLWKQTLTNLLFMTLALPPLKLLSGIPGFSARTFPHDPLPDWRKLTQPVLAIWGEADKAVPPQVSKTMVEQALKASGHHNYTLRTFPNGDHGLGYMKAEGTGEPVWTHVPGYSEALTDWIHNLT
ncbi:alpha/beta hydrolase family protein [Dictyobacter kobayashii]|uniref:AB hydrolase-1 domain-containing protein n=1 Tax=Dictyobacter kobayashii TaxID=2014872 RepID=A0A402APY8_9CHLR|nr:alpha/beta fold hydrolase [Dictyobacter kobayashii]GCE21187.1 hypothetical protein KDK_49870 [Dictyobacter kobayashii]